MTAAALGTLVNLDTLEAERDDLDAAEATVELQIPAGTQSHARIAIAGRGVPRLRGGGRGELGITLLVDTPTKLDLAQRDLLAQLAQERGETRPQVSVAKHGKGRFGWLKEAFS
jgi:molecular chaperone DnaJ